MPAKPMHPCAQAPACTNLATGRYCTVCTQRDAKARGTTTERGYGYAHAKKREAMLKRNPFCVSCQATGRMIGATVRDHVIPKERGGSDGTENEQGLCGTCHAIKRNAEARGRQLRVTQGLGLVDVGPLPPRLRLLTNAGVVA